MYEYLPNWLGHKARLTVTMDHLNPLCCRITRRLTSLTAKDADIKISHFLGVCAWKLGIKKRLPSRRVVSGSPFGPWAYPPTIGKCWIWSTLRWLKQVKQVTKHEINQFYQSHVSICPVKIMCHQLWLNICPVRSRHGLGPQCGGPMVKTWVTHGHQSMFIWIYVWIFMAWDDHAQYTMFWPQLFWCSGWSIKAIGFWPIPAFELSTWKRMETHHTLSQNQSWLLKPKQTDM